MPKTLPKETDEKECPRCFKVKLVKDFGFRECKSYVQDQPVFKVYVQAQCKKCRNQKPLIQTKKEAEAEQKRRQEADEIGKQILAATIPLEMKKAPPEMVKTWEENAAKLSKPKLKLKAKPPEQKKATPKLKHIWITGDKGTLRIMYKEHYPKDTNNDKRAAKFMIQKLMKRLGDKAKLTPTAQKILEG